MSAFRGTGYNGYCRPVRARRQRGAVKVAKVAKIATFFVPPPPPGPGLSRSVRVCAVPLYPLFLDLAGRRCLVVGAGPVGQRKAAGLLDAGARVRIVAPGGVGQVSNLSRRGAATNPPSAGQVTNRSHAASLECIDGEYRPAHLDGVALAFAAATPEVNARVVADAKARGIWVNNASDPEGADFAVPAHRRNRFVQIAVTTGGMSPAVAARFADAMAEALDDGWINLVIAHHILRQQVRERVPKARRRALWAALSEPVWRDRLRTETVTSVLEAMQPLVDAAAGP
jgi:precorrin-2 dehydrogenase/sirohydrochlorin ferrochelatase